MSFFVLIELSEYSEFFEYLDNSKNAVVVEKFSVIRDTEKSPAF